MLLIHHRRLLSYKDITEHRKNETYTNQIGHSGTQQKANLARSKRLLTLWLSFFIAADRRFISGASSTCIPSSPEGTKKSVELVSA